MMCVHGGGAGDMCVYEDGTDVMCAGLVVVPMWCVHTVVVTERVRAHGDKVRVRSAHPDAGQT